MNILTPSEINDIKICGRKLSEALDAVIKSIKAGASTLDLDNIAFSELEKRGCKPAFKDYYVEGIGQYPSTLCVSVNDEIVHGIPNKDRILKNGDVVSLDIGAEYHHIFTDMAYTVVVGPISKDKKRLLEGTKKSLERGIEQAYFGHHIGDIGAAVEKEAEKYDLGIIRDYVGHGIGEQPHLPPQIPNYGIAGTGVQIVEGMALAIEPMLTLGSEKTVVASDGWTVKTADGSLAAHFEHTVVIENGKPIIVTK